MLLMWSNFQLLIYVVIKQTWEEKQQLVTSLPCSNLVLSTVQFWMTSSSKILD